MSSDKISSVQEPVLALDMEVQTTDGRKTVSVELNKEQLSNMINSLEGANKVMIHLFTKVSLSPFICTAHYLHLVHG
jgi:hypothetical protein